MKESINKEEEKKKNHSW